MKWKRGERRTREEGRRQRALRCTWWVEGGELRGWSKLLSGGLDAGSAGRSEANAKVVAAGTETQEL